MKNLKKILALVLAFACAFTMFAGAASYSDKADIKASTAVDMLSSLGVIQGYDDGSFKPDTTVTRAQMAKMIFTIMNGGNDNADAYVSLPTKFTDLPTAAWAQGYVRYLQNTGIIAGKSATEFAPNKTVTGLEAAKMVLVAAGYNAEKAGLTGAAWAQNTMKYGQLNNLFEDVNTNLNAALPRQYAAQILYNALDMERVVWSNDIEDFKPATDISDDRTIGGKYMDLVKTKAAQLTKVEKTSGKDTYEITVGGDSYDKVPTDVSDLIGLNVKVLKKVKSNGDVDVYGVYADDDSKIIATGTVGELKSVSGENKKTKLKDTEYKLDNDKSKVKAIEPNVSTTVALTDLEGYTDIDKVAGTVKLIDTNGNNKADVVVYIPAVVGKITYVGSKSITINNGVGSQDIGDLDIYTGYAKDDYVAVVNEKLTASGDYVVTKLDTTSAKVNSIKSSTPVEVKINDSWFKIATGSVADDTASVKAGSTYDFVTVGNYVVNAKETESASTDVLMLADYDTTNKGFTGSATTTNVKAYFMDGSSKTITVEKFSNDPSKEAADLKSGNTISGSDLNKLYTYSTRSNGNYSLRALGTGNKAGYETINTASTIDNKQKVNNTAFNDSAVVFVAYGDVAGSSAKDKVKILTGKTVNDWKNAYGTSVQYATKKTNGLETVRVAVVTADATYSGAGSNYKYAYMTSDAYKGTEGEDNDDVTVYEVWNGSENVTLKHDGNDGKLLKAGDLLIYTNDGDKFINVENDATDVAVYKVAITGMDKKSEGNVAVQGAKLDGTALKATNFDMDKDIVFLAVNDDKQEGVSGSSMDQVSIAEETTTSGNYYANAYIVVETSGDKNILAIVYDADNNRLDGEPVYNASGAVVH
ncbi:S-layer homology domain-containing protein [uncultured Agathobaculum sp.]|uniref:S-layer homology domain-containing protein n=1 Tax=uncultured Agathobaculum sp. TaxID=2048140 RepID=UPI00296F1B3C